MYRKSQNLDGSEIAFELPFNGKLCEENRWVILANLIPWSEFESEYAQNFSEEMGAPAKPFRMALGALIIKEKLGISDRETVEQIKENPYLQYFIGQKSYRNEAPFEASMMVHFRERIEGSLIQKINQKVVQRGRGFKPEEPPAKKSGGEKTKTGNRGQLLIDATVAPADIKYPTDVELLNQGRKTTEKIIDYNESGDFISQIESDKEEIGVYPSSVHADQIYRTRVHRAWCKERGIRLSGSPLGRPPLKVSREVKKQAQEDEGIRNEIEGKFGQAKRRFSLNRVMAKLSNTSETSIAMTFLVMNLVKLLRQFYCLFLCQFFPNINVLPRSINTSYETNPLSQVGLMLWTRRPSSSFPTPCFF